jgi:uncharacterized protein (DUF1501 family)
VGHVPTRRDFVKLALGTTAWMAGAATLGCRPKPRRTEAGPRYFVLVLLSGGHDTLYTTDPKLLKDVDDLVTLPTENTIVPAANMSFGSHFAKLSRWGNELAVLNGVQVRTANHETGQKQFFHLKTDIVDRMPNVLDVIASHRSGQPLGVASINLSHRVMHSPGYFGSADKFYFGEVDVFEQASHASPAELDELAKVMRRRAGELAATSGGREQDQTAVYMREVADFFERVAAVPPLVSAERSTDYVAQSMAESFDRALWLMENDLVSGVVLDLGLLGWDTHIRNESKQQEMSTNFATFFDEYLTQLHARSNRHGSLASRTVTVVGSELGRFPRQNDMLGKDHFPQTSFMFHGPGIVKGRAFGRTGRKMEGLPIAYRNGDAADAGRVPLLDDIGTTLLRVAGVDPERYGYSGEVCEFLLDKTA